MTSVTQVSCLRFRYLSSYASLDVLKYTQDTQQNLLNMDGNGEQPVWHRTQTPLDPGTYGIIFVMFYQADNEESVYNGIDQIQILQGHCNQLPTEGEKGLFSWLFFERIFI